MSKKIGDVSCSDENVKTTVKKKSDDFDETSAETRNILRLTSYTVSKKLQVVKWHKENGGNFSKTSRQFNIDRKVIRDWLRKEIALLQHNHGENKFLRKIHPGGPVFSKELDGALYEYLQRKRNSGFNVSNRQLSQEALRIAKRLGLDTSKFFASCQYLCRWKIRYNVTSSKAIKNGASTRSIGNQKKVKNVNSVTPTDMNIEILSNIKIESQEIPEDHSKTIGSDPVPMTLLEVQYIQQGENVYKVLVPKEIKERQEEEESILPNSTQPVNPIICQVQDLSKFQELCGDNVETPHLTSFVSLSSQFQTLKSLVRLKVKSDSSGNQVVVPATRVASASNKTCLERNPKIQSRQEELLGPLLKADSPESGSDRHEQAETQTKSDTEEHLLDSYVKSQPDVYMPPCYTDKGQGSVFEPLCDLATDLSQNSSVLESDQCSDYSAQETNKLGSVPSSEGSSNVDGKAVAKNPAESMLKFKTLPPNVLPFLSSGVTKTFVIRPGVIPVGTLSATTKEPSGKVAAVSPTFSLLENIKNRNQRISPATTPFARSVLKPSEPTSERKDHNAFFNFQIKNSMFHSRSISARGTVLGDKQTSSVADTENKSPIIVKVNSFLNPKLPSKNAKAVLASVSCDTQTVTHSSTLFTAKSNSHTDGTCSAKQSIFISSISSPGNSAFSSEQKRSSCTDTDPKNEKSKVSNDPLSGDKMCDSDNAISLSQAPQGKATTLETVTSPAPVANPKININIPVRLHIRKASLLNENQKQYKYQSIFPKSPRPILPRPGLQKSLVKTETLPIMERSVSIIRRVVKRPMMISSSKAFNQTGSNKTVVTPSNENQPRLTTNTLSNPENTAVSTSNSTNPSSSGAKVVERVARKRTRRIAKKKPCQQESPSTMLTNCFRSSGPSNSDKQSSSSSDSDDSYYNKPAPNDFSYMKECQTYNNSKEGCDLSESSSSDVESYKCRAIELQMEFDRKKALNIRKKCTFPKRSLLKDHSFMSSELKAIQKAIAHFRNKILNHVKKEDQRNSANSCATTFHAGKLADSLVRTDLAGKQADRFVRTDHARKLAETIKPCAVRLTRLSIPPNIPISVYTKMLSCSNDPTPGSSSFKVSQMAPQDGSSKTFLKTAKLENNSVDTRFGFQTKTRSQLPDTSAAVMDAVAHNRRKAPKRSLDAASKGDSEKPDPKLNTSTGCRPRSVFSSSGSLDVTEQEQKCEQVLRSKLPCGTFDNLNAKAMELEPRVETKCATVKKWKGRRRRRRKRGRCDLKNQYNAVLERKTETLANPEGPSSTTTGNYSNVTRDGYEVSKTCGNYYYMDKICIKSEPESPSEEATDDIDCDTQVNESAADLESSSVSSFVNAKSEETSRTGMGVEAPSEADLESSSVSSFVNVKSEETSRSSMGVEAPPEDDHISGVTNSDDDFQPDDIGIDCGVRTDISLQHNQEPGCVSNDTKGVHIVNDTEQVPVANDKFTSLMKMIEQKEKLLHQYREKFGKL